MLTWGCLFDGVHGFGLGLSAAGAGDASWTVEWADFPRRILKLRVPDAEHLADVRDVVNPPRVKGLSGGFPCQDLSAAGLGAGIRGSRSGLWTEYARIIGEVEPEVVLIENVPPLLRRGMDLVVANLVELGYGVEWDCLPAAALGAPHLRDRVWIVAHRLGAPVIFGQPAALFAVPPGVAAEVVGSDDDEGDSDPAWRRWPRAGWVDGDPDLVMPLEPLAPLAAVRGGRGIGTGLMPTPEASDASGGRVAKDLGGKRPSGAKRAIPLATAVAHGLEPGAPEGGHWPTPAGMDASSGHKRRSDTRGRHALALHHLGNSGVLDGPGGADEAVDRHGDLFPTPNASDGLGGRNELAAVQRAIDGGAQSVEDLRTLERPSGAKAALSLGTRVMAEDLLPTPTAADGERESEQGIRYYRNGTDNPTLLGAARRLDGTANPDLIPGHLWPTPAASDGERGPDYARNDGDGRARSGGDDLVTAIARERPEARGRGSERKGALNPDWVEWLMGFPVGWTDPDVADADLRPHGWQSEPDLPRVTHRVEHRRPRLSALGNALVPQIPHWIASRYLAARDRARAAA